jgi:integrase
VTVRDWRGSVTFRNGGAYIKYKRSGRWVGPEATPYKVGPELTREEAEAKAWELIERIRAAGAVLQRHSGRDGVITLRSFGEGWTARRTALGKVSAVDDASRLRLYVYPTLGDLPLTRIAAQPMLVADLLSAIAQRDSKKGGQLAPKTIRHTYSALHSLFNDAEIRGAIPRGMNPCIHGDTEYLPAPRDKHTGWRENAQYPLEEVELLISAPVIHFERRVANAIKFLAGLRPGEVHALRWSNYSPQLEPLGRFMVERAWNSRAHVEKGTKTDRERKVPVHPVLAAILAQWRLSGFPEVYGRPPRPDDLIVPAPPVPIRGKRGHFERPTGIVVPHSRMRHINVRVANRLFQEDCRKIGVPVRRQYDARRTLTSMLRAIPAVNDLHRKWVTHGPSRNVQDDYTTLPWPVLCEVLLALKVTYRGLDGGKVLPIRRSP